MPSRTVPQGLATLLLLATTACAAQSPACTGNRYGTAVQAVAIEDALVDGDVAAAVAAIRAAQRTRGVELGCPEVATAYGPLDTAPASAAAVAATWAAHAFPDLPPPYAQCPPIGREMGAFALAHWWAAQAGATVDRALAARLADGFVDAQYVPARTPGEASTWPGLYAYSVRYGTPGDACFAGGVIEDGLALACSGDAPSLCTTYRTGRHAGQRFAIGSFSRTPRAYDGGAAFDQGWAGAMMAEAALGAPDDASAARWRESLRAAADWAVAEPAVRNHNYTAKAVWLLALAYDLGGEPRWRDGLVDKLERSLLPGVLMDADRDGVVDGVPGLRFAALVAPAARVPGRMWDAHNARPEYQAMNAWALVAAYAALRDRGDGALAARVRPYALATLDNLATEVLSFGGPAAATPGASQPPVALLLGLRMIADAEGQPRPDWERAAAAFWNAGVLQAPGGNRSASVALMLQRTRGLPWLSLGERAARRVPAGIAGSWFDPARSGEGWIVFPYAPDAAFLSWFTYDAVDPTRQLWLYGAGRWRDGRLEVDVLYRTEGARFGVAFDPAAVRQVRWGRASFEAATCRSARFVYQADDPSYGAATRELRKLAGVAGSGCP